MFDRGAYGRTIKCLMLVDGVTLKYVGLIAERAVAAPALMRISEKLHSARGPSLLICAENKKAILRLHKTPFGK